MSSFRSMLGQPQQWRRERGMTAFLRDVVVETGDIIKTAV